MESGSAESGFQQAHVQLILIMCDSSMVNDKNREPQSLGEETSFLPVLPSYTTLLLSHSQTCH